MIGSRIHVRMFVDGVELPVSAVGVSFTEGTGSQCSATIISADEMHDILPRALVTIFYLDSADADTRIQTRPSDGGDDVQAVLGTSVDEYKLLFMGELVSIDYRKTPSGRSATLTCQDFLSYLDSIKMYGANYSSGGIEQIENAFQGARLGRSRSTTASGKDLKTNLVNWISEQKTENEDGVSKENITIGIQRALREIFFSGNYFYSKAFNRLRLNDQFVGLPNDQTSINLFDLKYFKKFYDATLARQGSLSSARDILSTLQAPIMYNMVTIPCPYLNSDGVQCRVYDTTGTPLASKISEKTAFKGSMLNQFVLKPDSWFFAPPSCNVIFPHMYSDFRMQRNYTQETTRFILRTDDLIQGTAYQKETSWNYFAGRPFTSIAFAKPKRLKDRIYAPDIEEFAILMGQGSGQGHLADLNAILMNHERFTGPITTFGYAGPLGQYVSKSNRRKYMGFFTDYMFWKYRFQGRSGQVSMAFNPNIVPGFPAVILDRPLTEVERSEGKHRRHYVGHVVSVSHQLSPQGVTTHAQLVCLRPYDESIDFEALNRTNNEDEDKGEGASIERLAMGFHNEESYFDKRYAPENIGSEYYKHILGCDSIVDSFSIVGNPEADPRLQEVLKKIPGNEEELTVAKSILALSDIYDTAIREKVDLNLFSNGVTWRPKASLTQIMGGDNDDLASGQGIPSKNYPQLGGSSYRESGFMAGAVDPLSEDATSATYEATESRSVTSRQVVGQEEVSIIRGDTGNRDVTQAPVFGNVTSVTAVDAGTASYGLDDDLEERQKRLLAYLEAIRHRGMRG